METGEGVGKDQRRSKKHKDTRSRLRDRPGLIYSEPPCLALQSSLSSASASRDCRGAPSCLSSMYPCDLCARVWHISSQPRYIYGCERASEFARSRAPRADSRILHARCRCDEAAAAAADRPCFSLAKIMREYAARV